MKKLSILLVVLIAIIGCSKSPEEQISALYDEGMQELKNYNLVVAEEKFKKILEIDQTSEIALVGEALVREAKLEYYDAIDIYLFILSRTSGVEEAYKGLFRCYTILGFPNEAYDIAVEYDKIFIDNPEAIYLLGLAYRNLHEYPRAKKYIQDLASFDFDPATIDFITAYSFYKEGTIDSAEYYASEGLSALDTDDLGYQYAADYYEAKGALDSAVFYSTKYYQANTNDMYATFSHFKRLIRNNYFANARKVIMDLESTPIDSLTIVGCKLFLALAEDNRSLIRFYGQKYKALTPNSNTGVAYTMLSSAPIDDNLTMNQDLKAIKSNYASGKYSVEFGEFYIYAMTMSYIEDDKSPGSLDYLSEIGGIRRNRMDIRLNIALIKHVIGLFDECFADLKKIEAGHQYDPIWLTEIGNIYSHIAIKKYDEATKRYELALSELPSYLPAFENYLANLEKTGSYDKALQLYETYPFFEKNNYRAALYKSKYLCLAGKYDKAVEQFQRNFRFVSGDVEFVSTLMELLNERGAMKQYDKVLETALLINPENVDLRLMLANEENKKGNYEKEKALVDEVLKVEPNYAIAHTYKARSLYYTGQKTEAYDKFKENKLKYHNEPENLMIYSYLLAEEGIDYSNAANIAREAVFEGYGGAKYVMNLASIYFKMGRYDLAYGEASKASFVLKKSPETFYLMGVSRYHQDKNKFAEAVKTNLNKAIQFGLSGEKLTEAQSILKQI
ncbi:MAG: hypothetical protein DWP97_06925 [Calditrichaeota bacterium]|nr:MAG: hypothetical protein DWP97_06925 [Calditrichota bacterium]